MRRTSKFRRAKLFSRERMPEIRHSSHGCVIPLDDRKVSVIILRIGKDGIGYEFSESYGNFTIDESVESV